MINNDKRDEEERRECGTDWIGQGSEIERERERGGDTGQREMEREGGGGKRGVAHFATRVLSSPFNFLYADFFSTFSGFLFFLRALASEDKRRKKLAGGESCEETNE